MMKIEYFTNDFPYIIIDDVYTEKECEMILADYDRINEKGKLVDASYTNAAKNYDSEYQKSGKAGFWGRDINKEDFTDPDIFHKVFNEKIKTPLGVQLKTIAGHPNWFFREHKYDKINVLLSYYENDDFYKEHCDVAFITCLTWHYQLPKKFEGGNFHFTKQKIEIESKYNRMLIFPSMIPHSVDKVILNEEDCQKRYGRYCFTHFILPY